MSVGDAARRNESCATARFGSLDDFWRKFLRRRVDRAREHTLSRWPSIVYLFEGVTGTEELFEALRKHGFQSHFVAQSEAREFFFFAN